VVLKEGEERKKYGLRESGKHEETTEEKKGHTKESVQQTKTLQ
jgi:hypothetical protein